MELFRVFLGGLFTIAVIWAAGRLVARRTPLAPEFRFPTGAACVSLAVFLLLQFHAGYRGVFWIFGSGTIIAGLIARPEHEVPLPALPRLWNLLYRLTCAGFAIYFLVFALAPEIEADAVGYHLGLVSEYVRRHGMPTRVAFFDLLPQGMEMLFVPAFAIGRHSAAKLVHFAFLLNVLPLMRRAGAVVGVGPAASACAALLFFLSPVVTVDGTAAYSDVALTCAATAVFALLLRWKREDNGTLLLAAGLNAGFCYALKPTLGLVPLAGLVYIIWRRRNARLASLFTGTAAMIAFPWAARSFVLTGNPFAPFLNTLFLDDGIPPATEKSLAEIFGMFGPNFHWKTAFLDYTIWGGHQGMLGIAFLLSPLALLALRTKPGRWLLGYAAILLLTFPANAGTRFLMPAASPLTLALTSVLPAPVSVALVVVQGLGSVRPVLMRYNIRQDWKVPPFPLRAALRLEPEAEYLSHSSFDYRISQMINANTPPDARIYMMGPFEWAYLDREPLVFWHSSEAQKIWNDLIFIQLNAQKPATSAMWTWSGSQFRAIRIFAYPDVRVPFIQQIPGASIDLPWTTWSPSNPFTMPLAPGATGFVATLWPGDIEALKMDLQRGDGSWAPAPAPPEMKAVAANFRRAAMRRLFHAGYDYVLAPTAHDAFEEIGGDMVARPEDWGIQPAGQSGDSYLFRISAPPTR